ncbi:MAG: hypothetical protein IPP62_17980 [bacterium]|nr:hypothetical protein [bacterium]
MNGTVYSLVEHEGSLIAGGAFTLAGGIACQRIARWDGSNWNTMPGMNGTVVALGHFGGQLVAAGSFTTAGGVAASNIAIYNGTTWQPLGTGTNGQVLAMVEAGGRLYVGGGFTSAGGVSANRIAVWDGLTWSALGTGMNAAVRALAFADPYLYVGGDFTTADGMPSSYIALGRVAGCVQHGRDAAGGGGLALRWIALRDPLDVHGRLRGAGEHRAAARRRGLQPDCHRCREQRYLHVVRRAVRGGDRRLLGPGYGTEVAFLPRARCSRSCRPAFSR